MFSSCYGRTKKDDKTMLSSFGENEVRPTSASQVCPEVADNKQANPETKRHESQDQKMKKKDKQLVEKDKEIQRLNEELDSYRMSIKEKDERLSKDARQIKELVDKNESLLTRLSKMARERLTDGNPNIVDLSDGNRPTKLAENYSELYDNEWTNAFELLTKSGQSDENAILILVKSLCVIYIKCQNKANTDMERMKEAMKNFLGNRELQSDLIKPFKDQRKKQFQGHIKDMKKEVKNEIKQVIPEKKIRTDTNMKSFLNKSVELCWLMVIQDPFIFMDVNIKRYNEEYDNSSFKPYTKSGKYVDYIVWPPIYLHEGGSILSKGIVQCKSEKSTQVDRQESTSQTTSAVSGTVKDVKCPLNTGVQQLKPQAACVAENIETKQTGKDKGKRKDKMNLKTREEECNRTDWEKDQLTSDGKVGSLTSNIKSDVKSLDNRKRMSKSEATGVSSENFSASQIYDQTTHL